MKSSDESSSCASSTSGPIVNFANPSKCYRQIKENEREQQSLNLDVILSGFPEKPDCKTVVDLFLNRHQMSSEQKAIETYTLESSFRKKSHLQQSDN